MGGWGGPSHYVVTPTRVESEVIRAEAETCFLQYANKTFNVTFVLDDSNHFSAHKGSNNLR